MQPISFVRKNYVQAKARLVLREFDFHAPPVNIEAILKRRGVSLRYYMDDDGPPGITFEMNGKLTVFIKNCTAGRELWSMAHELGHIELGHLNLNIDSLFEDHLTEQQRYILDREADLFVRDLLMPAKWVRGAVSGPLNYRTVKTLAKKFGVSCQAMSIRLSELGFLTQVQSGRFTADPEVVFVARDISLIGPKI